MSGQPLQPYGPYVSYNPKGDGRHPVNIAGPNPNPLPARLDDVPSEPEHTEADFPDPLPYWLL